MHVNDLIKIIEDIAPPACAASWDRGGVQVAAHRGHVDKLGVALDPVPGSVDKAMDWGADFLLTHHPLALKPSLPDHADDAYHYVLGALLRSDVWLYSAHTSLDVQPGGPVRWLAGELGLEDVAVLEPTGKRSARWFKILGQAAVLATVTRDLEQAADIEFFSMSPQVLELVCPEQLSPVVWAAVLNDTSGSLRVLSQELDHPAETIGFGFVGSLPDPLNWEALAHFLEKALGRQVVVLAGAVPEVIRRVACCPGSGASMLHRVRQAKADVFITGDLKYHDARTAEELGLLVVDVGHFSLEEGMMRTLAGQLQVKLANHGVQVEFFSGQDAFVHVFRAGT